MANGKFQIVFRALFAFCYFKLLSFRVVASRPKISEKEKKV